MLFSLVMAASLAAVPESRPNLIFILADDLGYGDVACYGSDAVETPHLDQLARSGMRWTRFYAASAVCTPTRASCLTGRYPLHFGITRHFADGDEHLPAGTTTLPQLLRSAGYVTAHVGKWHLGGLRKSEIADRGRRIPGPLQHGFDHYLATYEESDPRQKLLVNRRLYRDTGKYMVRNDRPAESTDRHWEDFKIDESLDLIESCHRQGRPFYLNLWLDAPHTPYEPAPEPHLSKYKDRAGEDDLLYRSMVSHLDAGVGRIVAKLEQLGIAEKTFILFTSDNGPSFQGSPGPWKGGKADLHEGGIRVPMIASWPGRIPAGTECDALGHTNDLLPTFCEAAGLRLPDGLGLDGVSLLAQLTDQAPPRERGTIFWQMGLYTWYPQPGDKPEPYATEVARRGSWKLMARDGRPVALFDLAADPGEQQNLLESKQDVRDDLTRELKAWLEPLKQATREDDPGPREVRLDASPAQVLALGSDINGTPERPTTLLANGPISGNRVIQGWEETVLHGKRCWVAEVPEVRAGRWYFRQLFVNGERRHRPRLPRDGSYRFSGVPDWDPQQGYTPGQKRAQYEPGHFNPAWINRDDIEIVVLHYWVAPRMQIAAVDAQNRILEFTQATRRRLTDSFNTRQFARYYVDNVYEAMTEPGEWYLDRPTGRVYYMPLDRERMEETIIAAPGLPQLLRIEGAPGKPVEHVVLSGLTFTGTEWYDAAMNVADRQASMEVPAVLSLRHARHIRIENCTIRGVGTYGIEIGEGCEDIVVDNCTLTDLGAGGIKIGHGSRRTTVRDCTIGDGGKLFHNAIGVWIGHSHDNRVAHNEVHDFYYTAVSVGWTWGYREPSQAAGNIIEFNHLHHIGRGLLSDMAGVYTLGVSPGTIVRHNLIHDIEADNYGGWGLYTDEGSTGILMEHNLVYRTTHGGFHQHYGRDNIIRNNILAFGKHAQVMRTRQEEHNSFTFERNIVYFHDGALLEGKWDDRFIADRNCYWHSGGQEISFKGATLEQWQARGHDVHSIVADPGFVDPATGDFSLSPDSPALRLGFEPIDVSGVGPARNRSPDKKP